MSLSIVSGASFASFAVSILQTPCQEQLGNEIEGNRWRECSQSDDLAAADQAVP